MKYILNINEGASDNLGDQAISESLTSILLDNKLESDTYNFTQVEIVNKIDIKKVPSNEKVQKTFLRMFLSKFKLMQQLRWFQLNLKKIITVSRNHYNIAFIGGGQLVLSNTIFPIAMFTWVLILRAFGTKVIILGVGSGKKFNFADKLLYKISFMLCNDIFLRDQESIIQLKKTFGIKADFIPDIAFYYEKIKKKHNNLLQKKLVLGIIEYPIFVKYSSEVGNVVTTEEEYIKLWTADVLSLNQNFSEIILASTTSEDLICSKKLYNHLKKLKLSSKINFISNVLSLEEYTNLLRNSDVVMSARMHSLILAQLLGCDIVPWNVSKKIESYKKEYLNRNILDIQEEIKSVISSVIKKYKLNIYIIEIDRIV
jgi:polysaccharide pyruvyl transferase WcaK-like protein